MCYNLVFMTRKKIDYARWHGASEEELSQLAQELRDLEEKLDKRPPMFHANAWTMPDIPVITDKAPRTIQFLEWGLIANEHWNRHLKDFVKPAKRKFNARGEDMFKTPSFRKAAMHTRCLILVDGFYEYHTAGKKKYPFYIRLKSGKPFCMGGLWAVRDFTAEGVTKITAAVITCAPNDLMAAIHNQPAASEGPRMPLIIPPSLYKEWLAHKGDDEVEKKRILEMVQPYPQQEMVAHTVHRFTGKNAVPNSPLKLEKVVYDELKLPF